VSFLRWISLVLFLLVMAAFANGVRSWEMLAAAALLVLVVFWTCGAFSRDVWFGPPAIDAECERLDAELDALDNTYP